MKNTKPHVYTSTTAAATALRISPSLLRRVKKAGCSAFRANGAVNLEELCSWLLRKKVTGPEASELDQARTRLANATAAERERKNRLESAELVHIADVDRLWTQTQLLPLRQWLQSLPETLDVRCNAAHPEVARTALTQARDDCLKLLREKLPPLK